MEKRNIRIIIKRTSELTLTDKENFMYVHEKEYGNKIKEESYNKKYFENIYGFSIIIFAFDEDKCIGTQVFLRNDINGQEAYQSSDSIVLSEYRGMGLFSKMVKEGVAYIGDKALIYGFPNNNSLPAFEKMGWLIKKRKKYNLWRKNAWNEIDKIDEAYFEWLIAGNDKLFFIKRNKRYFIVKNRSRNLCVVYGEISEEQTKYLNRIKVPIVMYYSEDGKFGNGMIQVIINKDDITIPIYKMDTLL